MMKLITVRDLIRRAPVEWNRHYGDEGGDRQRINQQLAALDVETITAEQVNAIIGGPWWTELKCDECGRHVEAVVQLGADPPDYGTDTLQLCQGCLGMAFTLIAQRRADG